MFSFFLLINHALNFKLRRGSPSVIMYSIWNPRYAFFFSFFIFSVLWIYIFFKASFCTLKPLLLGVPGNNSLEMGVRSHLHVILGVLDMKTFENHRFGRGIKYSKTSADFSLLFHYTVHCSTLSISLFSVKITCLSLGGGTSRGQMIRRMLAAIMTNALKSSKSLHGDAKEGLWWVGSLMNIH